MGEYDSKLIIMNKNVQSGPAGPVVTWSDGLEIIGALQLSNTVQTLTAQAQGVKSNGYLRIDRSLEKYITLDTYLKSLRDNQYVRVAGTGVIEAGEAEHGTRQYPIESATTLPR